MREKPVLAKARTQSQSSEIQVEEKSGFVIPSIVRKIPSLSRQKFSMWTKQVQVI